MASPARSAGVETVPADLPRYASLIHLLDAAARASAGHTAIVCQKRRIAYGDLGRAVAGLADRITAETGSRVLILVPNSIEAVIAYFGAMAAGCQAAAVNPFYSAGEQDRLVAKLEPAAILCVAQTSDAAERLAAEFSVREVINLEDASCCVDALIAAAPDGLVDDHFREPDDPAILFYTGGTTGLPKAVDHRHRTLVATALLHNTVWPTEDGAEVVLNVAPIFHIWGFGYGVLTSLFARSTFVLIPKYDPDEVLDAIGAHEVTIFGGGPAPIYQGLMASDKAATTDYASLRYCLSGGAPCPAELHRRWRELTGCELFEGWGMSEGAPLCLNPLHGERKVMSVGRPVPDTDIEVVDVDDGDRLLERGEAGEVRVRGPQIMRGYRDEPEETAVAMRNGWLYTGDVGYIDVDGYLFLVDRKKDMVIVGGYNVYPREVDELLAGHPAIREASVVGRPDERLGEVIVAFVALKPDETLTTEACLAYCRDNLVKYKRPVDVHFVEALPRTPANKIDKLTLRRLALETAPSR